MRRLIAFSLALSVVSSAKAQDATPSHKRGRVHSVRYVPSRPIRLETTPGSDITVLFERGEHINDIQLENFTHYQATLSADQDSVLIHTKNVPSLFAFDKVLLRVSSVRRTYQFILVNAGAGHGSASVLKVRYPKRYKRSEKKANVLPSQYLLIGEHEVRPTTIHDDGAKTYIAWSASSAVPAVFAIEHGREEMVEGYVRAGIYTIDRVYMRLIFRIDKHVATAERLLRPSTQ